MISLIYEYFLKTHTNREHIGGCHCQGWRWGKWGKVVKRYKIPVIRLISSTGLMYSMVTIVNNIVYLKVPKRVDIKSSYYKKKIITM